MNRDEALKWLVDNVKVWPAALSSGETYKVPIGCAWYEFPGCVKLGKPGEDWLITVNCWLHARNQEQDGAIEKPKCTPANLGTAGSFLARSADLLSQRGEDYDSEEGERSMGATVEAFNAITGHQLTEEQGWQFMILLKLVRQNTSEAWHRDSAEDTVAYSALAAEAGSKQHG